MEQPLSEEYNEDFKKIKLSDNKYLKVDISDIKESLLDEIKEDLSDIKEDISYIKGDISDIQGFVNDIDGEIYNIKHLIEVKTDEIKKILQFKNEPFCFNKWIISKFW